LSRKISASALVQRKRETRKKENSCAFNINSFFFLFEPLHNLPLVTSVVRVRVRGSFSPVACSLFVKLAFFERNECIQFFVAAANT
jgi:hypothetical protein